MTAAAEQVYDDPTLPIFRAEVDRYLEANRFRESVFDLSRNAQAAGLAAVRSWWERHPGNNHDDYSQLKHTSITAEKDRLKNAGWTCLGYVTGYVLAPPGWQPSTGESTDPASPVDGAP